MLQLSTPVNSSSHYDTDSPATTMTTATTLVTNKVLTTPEILEMILLQIDNTLMPELMPDSWISCRGSRLIESGGRSSNPLFLGIL